MATMHIGARAGARAGVAQAKVTRTDGTVEYHYSVPTVPWWRFTQRAWVRRRLDALRAEETA